MSLNLMIICETPEEAKNADLTSINRIFFDLEVINKHERQRGLNTVISKNNISDLGGIKEKIKNSDLLVRTNPMNSQLKYELDAVLEYKPDYLMLPMVIDPFDVKKYIEYVGGKSKIIIMVETAQALARIDNILEIDGIDEIFIGLNDLHLSLGLNFMFEVLSSGLVEYLANKCLAKRTQFGFGGIARIGDGILPAENILGEHYRMNSSSVILSRTFKGNVDSKFPQKVDFNLEVDKVRQKEAEISNWSIDDFELNKKKVFKIVNQIIQHHV